AGPAGIPGRANRSLVRLTGPADTAALTDRLRADGTVLTYDPDNRTLPAGDAPAVVIGETAASTHPPRNEERGTASGKRRRRAPAAAGGWARVAIEHARERPLMGI